MARSNRSPFRNYTNTDHSPMDDVMEGKIWDRKKIKTN